MSRGKGPLIFVVYLEQRVPYHSPYAIITHSLTLESQLVLFMSQRGEKIKKRNAYD